MRSGWSSPGDDPVTGGPAYPTDRTPPHAQAPVRLRPAYPDQRRPSPGYRPGREPVSYPVLPRTLPMPPPPGNAVVPYVPRYPSVQPQVPHYGYTVQHAPIAAFPSGYAPPAVPQNSGLCVGSMVFGILGLVFLCCDFGVFSLIAVILGHLGLAQARDGRRVGQGFGIAGLVLGYTVLIPAFAVSVVVVLGRTVAALH